MSRVILVRHGEASWHSADYDQLTERGHAQARVVGEELRERHVAADLLVSGTLRRHRETAEGLLAGAGWVGTFEQDSRFDELDADDIVRVHLPQHETMTAMLAAHEGQGAGSFDESFGLAMVRWLTGDGEYAEGFEAFNERVRAGLDAVLDALDPMGTAVVVTSGGVMNSVASHVLGGGAETWMRIFGMFPNTGIMRLAHSERGLRLLSMGEIGHLHRRPDLLSDR